MAKLIAPVKSLNRIFEWTYAVMGKSGATEFAIL